MGTPESLESIDVPSDLAAALEQHEQARHAFNQLTQSGQYAVVLSLLKATTAASRAIRLQKVFVADKIPHELQSIVEFLNRQMDPAEVLAVEIKQFVGKNMKTLVPRVVDATAEAQQRKSTGQREKHQWDEGSFFLVCIIGDDGRTSTR